MKFGCEFKCYYVTWYLESVLPIVYAQLYNVNRILQYTQGTTVDCQTTNFIEAGL